MNNEWAAVRDGAASPEEFVRLANLAMREGDFETIYDAARARCWALVRAGGSGSEIHLWAKAIQRVRAICLAGEGGDRTASRLETIGDLVADTIQFAHHHSKPDVLKRAHVNNLLRVIAAQGGRVRRAQLLKLTKLGNPNLSRVLSVLEGNALIARNQIDGREVEISLSEEGMRAAKMATPQPVAHVQPAVVVEKGSRELKRLRGRFRVKGQSVFVVDKGLLPTKTRRLVLTEIQGVSGKWRSRTEDERDAVMASQ